MKAIYYFITLVWMLSFTSCANSDDFNSNETSLFESVKNLYGLETTTGAVGGTEKVPSVTLSEMQTVLEALRNGSNTTRSCVVENSSNGYFGGTNESAQKVVMAGEYQPTKSSSAQVNNFLLRVELNFTIDNGQVYYLGTDYIYSSESFVWRANGLSLAPAKNASGFTYEFNSESFLYFKVSDESNCMVKVPLVFKGNYDFNSKKGVYSFQLLKYAK